MTTAAPPRAPASPTLLVPPPLRGWLAAFAIVRAYVIASYIHALLDQTIYVRTGWGTTELHAQVLRKLVVLSVSLVLDGIGMALLLRRDRLAPRWWIAVLALQVGWFVLGTLPRILGIVDIPLAVWVLSLALPVLWLALWIFSPRVGETFGPAAPRWTEAQGRRASGLTAGGFVLAVAWLVVFGAALFWAATGLWRPLLFVTWSAVALPLWIVTWIWARMARTAVGAWLLPLWLAVLAVVWFGRVPGTLPLPLLSLVRTFDLAFGLEGVAFALAMWMLARGMRGVAPPLPPTAGS